MTIDEIEGMSDAEYFALSATEKAEIMAVILATLEADGLAYKGVDGRYRMREDVEYLGGGRARTKPLH